MPSTNDLVAFAKFETACSVEFADFESFATRITYELIFKKGKGEPVNEGVLKMAQGALTHRLQGYNRMLAKTRYLAGDQLTAVDLFHLPFGDAMIQVC
ncbi:hypothetical protein ASPZODRAFT_131692 [Penicilliopsis zonata CBS 506.65]|uniref:GST C-terminal domain-containing protein n=1 Tax=Penicilliopsis zonata CBS 506.65 TaxID=1073090 RepID=A0A1L9SLF7_9EURO|nr:hypothetical protein ASPZODRAFT_131692 [Penicilliopsis zonata CBS 506.65]OJJ48049.1 hypothetical protein ASPZODRAFT_131692 [Penicilliopsis zonata CBS 506.65]